MNKKIGKKMFILATVASIGTSFTVTSLDKASAAPVNDTEYMSQINTQTNATIIDWKKPIEEAMQRMGKKFAADNPERGKFLGINDVRYLNVKFLDFSVEQIKSKFVCKFPQLDCAT